MGKVEQLLSWSDVLLILGVSVVVGSGCATNARDLPPDYSSVDSKKRLSLDDFDPSSETLTCLEIGDELRELERAEALQRQDIQSKRHGNQVAGYVGSVFFLPALLATDNSGEAKRKIDDINRAKDKLYKLGVYRGCTLQPTEVDGR